MEEKKDTKKKNRLKELAVIKAQNELLEDAARRTREHYESLGDDTDDEKIDDILNGIDKAIMENRQAAMSYYGATEAEYKSVEYNKVLNSEVEKYNRRLKAKGMTHEQMAQKDISELENVKTSVSYGTENVKNDGETKGKASVSVSVNNKNVVLNDKPKRKTEVKNKVSEKKVEDGEPSEYLMKEFKKLHEIANKHNKTEENGEFDYGSIPSYVQYDIIPLPSNGQCYPIGSPLRNGRIAVSYLTASDENIIASPNMYRDGKIIDVILSRKILDKRISVGDLCSGDRDAIVLWLRATAYGIDFPIIATNPRNGKRYDVVAKLNEFKYKDFKLEGDENGLFEYKTESGDVLKFSFMTSDNEKDLRDRMSGDIDRLERRNIFNYCTNIMNAVKNVKFEEDVMNVVANCVSNISEIVDNGEEEEIEYTNGITEQMIMYTKSINGNEDCEYIRGYIENMRSKEAFSYRDYVSNNKCGVDFSMTVNVPESDGGGSFTTFLRFDDTVFINI